MDMNALICKFICRSLWFKSDTDMDSDMHYLTTSSTSRNPMNITCELANLIRREEKKLHAYVFRDLAESFTLGIGERHQPIASRYHPHPPVKPTIIPPSMGTVNWVPSSTPKVLLLLMNASDLMTGEPPYTTWQ
nr:PREDICTED: uncharacterized protein LOC108953138 [Musa acuminata subsp. malaccensis]